MATGPGRRRRTGLAVRTLAVVVLALTAACSSNDTPRSATTTSPPPATGGCNLERSPGGAPGEWSVRADLSVGAPVYGGGHVYLGANSEAGPAGCVFALDPATGEPAWITPGAIASGAAPLPVGDVVVAPVAPSSVLGLESATGAVRWRTPELGGFLARPPILLGGVVVVATDSALIGLDPKTGKETWRFQQAPLGTAAGPAGAFATFGAEDRTSKFAPETGKGVWAAVLSPRNAVITAVAQSMAILEDAPNTLLGLAGTDGAKLWERNIDGAKNSPIAAAGDELYFSADDGKGYRLDARSGAVVWTVPTGVSVVGAPLVIGGVVVFATGAPRPGLLAVDRGSGAVRWQAAAPAAVTAGPQLLADQLLLGTQKGDLCRVGAADGARVCTFVGGEVGDVNRLVPANGRQVLARVGERRVVSLPG